MTNVQPGEGGYKNKRDKKRHNKELAKSACYGKLKHRSMLAAQYILDRMSGRKSHLLEIYKCSFCNAFHIGHNRLLEVKNKTKTSA
jgi:hypothetical protein